MLCVLGYYQGDLDQAQKLAAWTKELGQLKNHALLIVRDKDVAGDEQVQADFREVFAKVDVIEPTADAWRTWPISANHVFATAARHIEHFKLGNWFWWEPDAIPLTSGWLDKIVEDHLQSGKPFSGADVNVPGIERHMSGLGCYPEQMSKHAGMALIAHETAFDVQAARQIIPQAHFTKLIAHSWDRDKDARPGRRTFENYEQVEREVFQPHPEAVLYHASKDGSLIERLKERRVAKQVNAADLKSVEATLAGSSPAPSTDIFIKTYPPDYKWLGYSLRSMERFCSGFRKIVIISLDALFDLKTNFALHLSIAVDYQSRFEFGMGSCTENNGYLSQQIFKLRADELTDADYILFMDSDTQFVRSVTPETFFKDGKILWMITPYPETQAPWKPITEKFLKMPVEYETMRRHPIVVPRWLLKEVRDFCQKTHNMPIEEYVMSQPAHEFSEFNVLGAYAYHFHRDKFSWVDTSKVPEIEWPILTVNQEWSHNPLDDERKAKLESILSGAEVTPEKNEAISSPGSAVPLASFSTTSGVTGYANPNLEWQRFGADSEREGFDMLSIISDRLDALDVPETDTIENEASVIPIDLRFECFLERQALPVSSVEKPYGSQSFKKETQLGSDELRARMASEKPLPAPWKDKVASQKEVDHYCAVLAMFCGAPSYKKKVRDALRKVKIIQ